MKLENLLKVLDSHSAINITKKYVDNSLKEVHKYVEFKVKNSTYKIRWSSNSCILYIHDFEHTFDYIDVYTVYNRHPEPNKKYLKFYDEGHDSFSRIPLNE